MSYRSSLGLQPGGRTQIFVAESEHGKGELLEDGGAAKLGSL